MAKKPEEAGQALQVKLLYDYWVAGDESFPDNQGEARKVAGSVISLPLKLAVALIQARKAEYAESPVAILEAQADAGNS